MGITSPSSYAALRMAVMHTLIVNRTADIDGGAREKDLAKRGSGIPVYIPVS